MQDNGVIRRYQGEKLVGITILDAAHRNKEEVMK